MPRVAGVPTQLLAVDIGGLAAIPVVLATIHFGVPSGFETFAFNHGEFRVYTLFTSAYVHTSDAHLYSNLVAYTLVIGFPYLLSIATDGRRWFYHTTLALLLVLPVLTSLTNYLVLGVYSDAVPVTFGFSPVVAGIIGLYIISITRLIAYRYTPTPAALTGLGLGVGIVQVVAVRYDLRLTVIAVAGIIAAGVVVSRYGTAWDDVIPNRDVLWDRTVVVDTLFVVLLAVTAGLFVLWLFPPSTQIAGDSGVINIVGHAAGLVCGTLIALVALRVETFPLNSRATPARRHGCR
jgi:hypothetical protein